jgi:hypothetical protein
MAHLSAWFAYVVLKKPGSGNGVWHHSVHDVISWKVSGYDIIKSLIKLTFSCNLSDDGVNIIPCWFGIVFQQYFEKVL